MILKATFIVNFLELSSLAEYFLLCLIAFPIRLIKWIQCFLSLVAQSLDLSNHCLDTQVLVLVTVLVTQDTDLVSEAREGQKVLQVTSRTVSKIREVYLRINMVPAP